MIEQKTSTGKNPAGQPASTSSKVNITKASGEKVPFSREQLGASLARSGAGKELIDNVINEVEKELYEGIPTKKIFHKAFALLKKSSKPQAARYKLKKAIMELGPSGYPFEKYVSEILKRQGFNVKVDQIVKGRCVSHEIDVIAERENKVFMIECKYHNTNGIICDVKIPLYIQARFEDVEKEMSNQPGDGAKFHQAWVVTNTRFSRDAIQYGQCVGLNLVGWDFPARKGLREQIDYFKLYPVTCLNTLTTNEKQRLLDNKIVLAKDISDNTSVLLSINVKPSRFDSILREVNLLCGLNSHH